MQTTAPTQPTPHSIRRIARGYNGSGLDVEFTSPVILSQSLPEEHQVLKFGNHVVLLSFRTNIDSLKSEWDFSWYIEPVSIVVSGYFFAPPRDRLNFSEDDIVIVSGSIGGQEIRTQAKTHPDSDQSYETIVTTSLEGIQRIQGVNGVPNQHSVQTQWVHCSFLGRVCNDLNNEHLQLEPECVEALREHGTFVEVQFYFNRAEGRSDLISKGAWPFFVYLAMNTTALNKYPWASDHSGKPTLRPGSYIYVSGIIVGQISPSHITKAGYEDGDPKNSCHIFVITPNLNLRVASSAEIGTSQPLAETFSPTAATRLAVQQRLQAASQQVSPSPRPTRPAQADRIPSTPVRTGLPPIDLTQEFDSDSTNRNSVTPEGDSEIDPADHDALRHEAQDLRAHPNRSPTPFYRPRRSYRHIEANPTTSLAPPAPGMSAPYSSPPMAAATIAPPLLQPTPASLPTSTIAPSLLQATSANYPTSTFAPRQTRQRTRQALSDNQESSAANPSGTEESTGQKPKFTAKRTSKKRKDPN